ncbi:MAG: amidohydrolase family protein [Clostridia bacterium]
MGVLFENATIVTMNDGREILRNAGLYVDGEEIAAIGDSQKLQDSYAAEADRVIDAGGKVLYPGLLNIHCHTMLLACRGRAEDVSNWDAIWGIMGSIMDVMTEDDCYAASKLAYMEMLKSGVTTAVDSGTHMMKVGEAAVDSGIRAYLHETFRDADPIKVRDEGVYQYSREMGERGLAHAVELVEKFHGREDGRILCLLGPHATDVCSPDLLRATREEADRLGVGVTIHLAQNEVEPQQCKEEWGDWPGPMMEKVGFLGSDFIGAHGIFLNEEDMAALGRNGCSVSHNPQINAKRAHIAPVSDMMDTGVNVGLGSDNMFYNMLEVMKIAQIVWRLRVGEPTEPKPETILEMATINGARALGVEDHLGSLEPGKAADIIMIDYDRPRYTPLVDENVVSNLIHFGSGDDVAMTMVGGRILVDEHRYVGDERKIIDEAQRSGEEVWERAKEDWTRRMGKNPD